MAKELTGIEAIKYSLTSKELLRFVNENRIRIRNLEKQLKEAKKRE